MRRVFDDTLYWLAVFLPGDAWADTARLADVSVALLITTEEVLAEFLTAVSAHGDRTRRLACRLVREILNDPNIEVVSPSHESFLAGLALYERRPDKQYSLVDCVKKTFRRSLRMTGTSRRKVSSDSYT
ncbi:MAG: nucleic acid-binding protein [Bryobacteraceae bacterium]